MARSKATRRSALRSLSQETRSSAEQSDSTTSSIRTSSESTRFSKSSLTLLNHFRNLDATETTLLLSPVVPHPPSSELEKNMDPFEPLGRAFHRNVRHVPYRGDVGLRDTHRAHIRSAAAIVVVVCCTKLIVGLNPRAFETQTKFASAVVETVQHLRPRGNVPVIVLLITDDDSRNAQVKALDTVSVLVTCNNYTPSVLRHTAQVLLGE
ncbi:hypothetical protein M011DRAFT_165431 [Sporormia fimetaria CBS 119925]|uniref:Uncharacterized protein n=1 Tax=Sporormia fimetaria CBS 119925 TaxID=1340428 RepID=A0A6A6V1X4_9PLEO|nr:hypothetical protein M011DRAFT_165431 [Sporormia fimetaria CBS 119925]